MNTVTETILDTVERISRMGLIDTLIDGVTRRIAPQTTAAAGCSYGSSCRFYDPYCAAAGFRPYGQYMYDQYGRLCGYVCCI